MGQLAGVSVSFMLGFQAPGAFQASMGWARWTALGWSGITEGYGIAGAAAGLTDGQLEWSDAFNIASLLPYGAAASGSIRSFLGTARSATGSVDDALRSAQQIEVTGGSYSVGQEGGIANQLVPGLTTRRETRRLRDFVRDQAGTTTIFGSENSNTIVGLDRNGNPLKRGNYYNPHSNEIHLVSGSRNQPRGMFMEEVQHALDQVVNPAWNDVPNLGNTRVHVGTFERMADNSAFNLAPRERSRLREQAQRWREQLDIRN